MTYLWLIVPAAIVGYSIYKRKRHRKQNGAPVRPNIDGSIGGNGA